MSDGWEIVILEDNRERCDAMRARLRDRFPQYSVHCFHEPAKLIDHLSMALSHTIAISLDHDLELIPRSDGSLFDPGTGMAVVDWLVTRTPVCPVIIHSTNLPAAKSMKQRLIRAGWKSRRITPYDDLAWIDAEWMTAVRQTLLDAASVPVPVDAAAHG